MQHTRVLVAVAAVALFTVSPAGAQSFRPQVEPTVKAERAKYPALVTPEQVGEILNAIAWAHRPNIQLLKKDGGGRCPSPISPLVYISCDIIIWAPPGTAASATTHVDVLSGASADGPATAAPYWKSAGPCVKSATSGCDMKNAVGPVQPGDILNPPPVTPPSSDLEQRVKALEDRVNRHLKD